MAFDGDLVEVAGGGGVEGVQGEVVEDEQVDADEAAEFVFVAALEPGGLEASGQPV